MAFNSEAPKESVVLNKCKKFLLPAAILAGFVTSIPVLASSASAAACGSACDYKDPMLYNCPGISTVRSAVVGVASVELRYSSNCRTIWSRGPYPSGRLNNVKTVRNDGAATFWTYGLGSSRPYTDMLNDSGFTSYGCNETKNSPFVPDVACTTSY
jgi:Protein of unknown function (DUF2690)